MLRLAELTRLFIAVKLINSVKVYRLYSRAPEKLRARNNFVYFFFNAVGAAVSVSVIRRNFLFVFIKQNVIHAPCVNSHRLGYFARSKAGFKPRLYLAYKVLGVPHKRAVFIFHTVFKAVHFKLF